MAGQDGFTLKLSQNGVYAVLLAFWCVQTVNAAILFGLFAWWTKFPGSRTLPRWFVIATLFAKTLYAVLTVVVASSSEETTPQVAAQNILWTLLYYVSRCGTFYIFYEIVHILINRFNDLKQYFAITRIVHGIVMAAIIVTAIVAWILLLVLEIRGKKMDYSGHSSSNGGETAHSVVSWVVGTEIVCWCAYLTAKGFKHRVSIKWKVLLIAALFTTIFFAAFTFFSALYDILYVSPGALFSPDSSALLGGSIFAALQVIFDVLAWVVLLFCWNQWAKIEQTQRRVVDRGPRDAGPAEIRDSSSATWLVEADSGLIPEVDGTPKQYHEADGRTKGILESRVHGKNMVFELDSRPRSEFFNAKQ
ncbi:hypothetical protein N7470_009436 [Penicillium chermesinum]|nr:hypothetical protein N7470_009436 [Penicillium chermesinum]